MANGKWEVCYLHTCQCQFYLPSELYDTAQRLREKFTFYCPYGHAQHYPSGESPQEKLRRERDRLAQRVAEKDDEIAYQKRQREATERRLSAARGQVTRIKNRVSHGVCPCCTRSFGNLKRHMETQHPGYSSSETLQ